MEDNLKDQSVWITWERQTRNRSASSYLDIPLFEIDHSRSTRIYRYFICSLKTVSIFFKKRPRFLFVQNPSVVLGVLAIFLKSLSRTTVIVDAHNSGIHGPENGNSLITKINKFIIKKADAVIVTNSHLASYVYSIGGTPIVLPDPLPQLGTCLNFDAGFANQNKLKVLCITSWSMDEPFLNLLEAASNFKQDIDFYFSGNYRKVKDEIPTTLQDNIKLLGFIDEKDFFHHLYTSDFCIDLTDRSDCMVCGAYESISAEKPIILSNTDVQKRYFSKGAVFCDNTSIGISNAIKIMAANHKQLKKEAEALRSEILQREENNKSIILRQIKNLKSKKSHN